MNNEIICGRKLNEIPSVKIDGEELYYYKDCSVEIFGKVNDKYMLFYVYSFENKKENYVFDFSKENEFSKFFKVEEKEVIKMGNEMTKQVIQKLHIDEKIEDRKKRGLFRW